MVAIYTLSVTLTRPVEETELPSAYLTSVSYRALEREILQALRRVEGDADCEVMTAMLSAD